MQYLTIERNYVSGTEQANVMHWTIKGEYHVTREALAQPVMDQTLS